MHRRCVPPRFSLSLRLRPYFGLNLAFIWLGEVPVARRSSFFAPLGLDVWLQSPRVHLRVETLRRGLCVWSFECALRVCPILLKDVWGGEERGLTCTASFTTEIRVKHKSLRDPRDIWQSSNNFEGLQQSSNTNFEVPSDILRVARFETVHHFWSCRGVRHVKLVKLARCPWHQRQR